ncbi:hypothetical protein BDN70DRAFT_887570 [Pholiota conissans]|uniref:Uncharacterized protein n=1 Tax=Pholiota conissans TaxID=109636 RepID=A0A9P6CTB6_9AGAR|nr:hypothetical protein BDN70DRAFT_887570 [Pholiota conissans]
MPNSMLHDKNGGPSAQESIVPLKRQNRRLIVYGFIAVACIYFFNQCITLTQEFETSSTHSTTFERPPALGNCIQESAWSSPQFEVHLPAGSLSPRLTKVASLHAFAILNIPLPTNPADLAQTAIGFISQHWPGTFKVITSPHQTQDTITLNVSTRYNTPGFLTSHSVRVCENNGWIEIYNPALKLGETTRADIMHLGMFDTTLIFPESDDSVSPPPMMRKFHAYTPDTEIIIGDAGSKLGFRRVIFNGNKTIEVNSLSTERAIITSYGGTIRGTFNVSATLTLTTSNSPIIVDLNLNNTQGGVLSVFATTTNSPIEITASLFSILPPQPPGFSISATTTNSPVDISFLTAPLDSSLQVKAVTTNSPAIVNAHPTYQGGFFLDNEGPELHENRGAVVDPSGEGRERRFEYTAVRQDLVAGKVFWGESPRPRPHFPWPNIFEEMIRVSTTNSPAVLNF